MTHRQDFDSAGDLATTDESTALVRVSALRKFTDLVTQLGGDADLVLSKVQLDPAVLENRHAVIPYRTLVRLLERAAVELQCPDFGMRLAVIQAGAKVLGPLGIAMRNSPTLSEALRYCAGHVQAYTAATQVSFEKSCAEGSTLMRLEILLARLPHQRQAVEQALLLIQRNVLNLSDGRVRAREIWLTQPPLSPLATYREYFGSPVRFERSVNGLVFAEGDLNVPIAGRDPQIYELATSFIEHHFPSAEPALSVRVRTIVERLLLEGSCTFAGIASTLGMHPRTLQRRLRAEGESFETIKDGVRRDMALRYLEQSALPLTRVAEILGYSETSALSRSCHRWFSASPRQLRGGRAKHAPAEGQGRRLAQTQATDRAKRDGSHRAPAA